MTDKELLRFAARNMEAIDKLIAVLIEEASDFCTKPAFPMVSRLLGMTQEYTREARDFLMDVSGAIKDEE